MRLLDMTLTKTWPMTLIRTWQLTWLRRFIFPSLCRNTHKLCSSHGKENLDTQALQNIAMMKMSSMVFSILLAGNLLGCCIAARKKSLRSSMLCTYVECTWSLVMPVKECNDLHLSLFSFLEWIVQQRTHQIVLDTRPCCYPMLPTMWSWESYTSLSILQDLDAKSRCSNLVHLYHLQRFYHATWPTTKDCSQGEQCCHTKWTLVFKSQHMIRT